MLFLIIAYIEHGIANKTNTERMKGYVIKYLSLPIHLSRKKIKDIPAIPQGDTCDKLLERIFSVIERLKSYLNRF